MTSKSAINKGIDSVYRSKNKEIKIERLIEWKSIETKRQKVVLSERWGVGSRLRGRKTIFHLYDTQKCERYRDVEQEEECGDGKKEKYFGPKCKMKR